MKLTIRDLKKIIMEEYEQVLTETAEDTYDLGDDPMPSFDPDADSEISTSSRHDQFSELRSLFHEYFHNSQEDRIDPNAPQYSLLTKALLIKNLTCALRFTAEKFENAWVSYRQALTGRLTTEVYKHDYYGDLPLGALGGMTISQPKVRKAREAAGVGGEEYDPFFIYMYEYGLSLEADVPCGGRGVLYPMRFIKAARKAGMGPEDYKVFKSYWDSLKDFQKIAFMTDDFSGIPEEPPDNKLQKSIVCPDYEVTDDVQNALLNLNHVYRSDPNVNIDCDEHFSGIPSGKWRKTGE